MGKSRDEVSEEQKPKKGRNKSAGGKGVSIKVGDLSNVSGPIQVAGGNIISKTATPAQIAKENERLAIARLKESIQKKMAYLLEESRTPPEPKSFHSGALQVNEGNYLVGRTQILNRMLRQFKTSQTEVLRAISGHGRTSLLQAGLIPRLLEDGHLPIMISYTGGELSPLIKTSFMTGVETDEYLNKLGLAKFLEYATNCMERVGKVFILFDGFEHLLGSPGKELDAFLGQWNQSRENSGLKWLFSVDRGYSAGLAAFHDGTALDLPPIDRDSATEALCSIEKGALKPGDEYLREILDGLESHRATVHGARINPSDLQIVLQYLTVNRNEQSVAKMYENHKGLNGIFEEYVTQIVNTNFRPEDRVSIRQILTILEDGYDEAIPMDPLESRVTAPGKDAEKIPGLLLKLKNFRILAVGDHAYGLAGINIKRGVLGWLNQQTLLDLAQAESKRQLDRIRASALRGLIAGGVALVVFRWIVGGPVRDPASVIFYSLLYAAMGGITGLLFTFLMDIFIIRNPRGASWQRYSLSAATGLLTFAATLAIFVFLGEVAENELVQLLLAAITGGAWGFVTGLGIGWALSLPRIPLWSVPLIALLSAVTLFLLNQYFHVLNIASPAEILAGGFWFPLVIVSAVLYGKNSDLS